MPTLVRGSNSFETLENLQAELATLPALTAATAATPEHLSHALVYAWFNIGALDLDFGSGVVTTRYFDSATLDSLDAKAQADLIQAQLVEADFSLSNTSTNRTGELRRVSVGASTTVYRNNRSVIVSADAVNILRPYLEPGFQHMARLHV
ncbi:MAG: hypothetical protein AAGI11_06395 [Pseudomonadota bacterium]